MRAKRHELQVKFKIDWWLRFLLLGKYSVFVLLIVDIWRTGQSIERLCEIVANDPLLGHEDSINDRNAMVRAGRALLSSVTRVLLLADIVVVKQLLLTKDKVSVCCALC